MKKLIIALIAGILALTQSCSVSDHIRFDTDFLSYEKQLQSITDKYDNYLTELNVGLSAVVIKDNTTISTNIGQGGFSQNTAFNIGSATKKMTAILLLQEVDKGNIQLSDSIGKYLSPIEHVDGSLTIEDLLRHQSGLGELVGRNAEMMFFTHHDSLYTSNFLDQIPAAKSDQVGSYEYCNTNYLLLGHIIEKVTNKKYFDLLRERIFEPCGMDESYPYLSTDIDNLAPPTHHGEDVSEHLDARFFAEFAYAAGSVVSTLDDLTKFYKVIFSDESILSKASLVEFVTFGDADYGLGIMKLDHNETIFYGHGGNNIGYAYREYYNPQTEEMVLYFSNNMTIPFASQIKRDLLDFLTNTKDESSAENNTHSDFTSSVGKYFFEEMNMELSLLEKDEKHFINVQGNDILMMDAEGNKLVSAYYGISLEKKPDTDDTLVFRQNGVEALISKIN